MNDNNVSHFSGTPPGFRSQTIVHESKTRIISPKDAARKQYRDLKAAEFNSTGQTVDTVRKGGKTEAWNAKTGFDKVKNRPGDSQVERYLDANF